MTAMLTLILDGIWGGYGWFGPLCKQLEERVGPTEFYRYRNGGVVQFEELGAELAQHVRVLDRPINIIGFSMGGLVIRAAHLLDPSLPIRRAAFINTPHGGSYMAYLLGRPGIVQMRPGSAFLQRIAVDAWDVPTLAMWCPGDLSVFPGWLARWSAATEKVCCWVPAHVWPMFSKRLTRRIVDFMGRGEGTTDSHRWTQIGRVTR